MRRPSESSPHASPGSAETFGTTDAPPPRRKSPTEIAAEELDQSPALAATLPGRLAGLSLPRQVFVLAFWPFLEQLLNFLVGFVDTALAGHLSSEAAGALGVGAYVSWLVNLLHNCVGVGAAALISRAVGGGHRSLAHAALGQALLLALGMGLLTALLINLLAPSLAAFGSLQGQAAHDCSVYLRVVSASAPFGALFAVGAACLRASGDTRSPFPVLLLVNLTNIAVSVLLVRQGWGVAGIASGTFLAWGLGALAMLLLLLRGWGGLRLHPGRLRPHAHTLWRIARVGLPNLAESLLGMWTVNFMVLRIVGLVGAHEALGAHMIAVRVEAISYMLGYAVGTAAATLVGQYLGAGQPRRARQAALLCWFLGAGVMGFMGLFFIFTPEPLVRLTTDEPVLLQTAPTLLRICGFVQAFFGSAIVLGSAMRGAGDTRTTFWLTVASVYGVRLPLVYTLALPLNLGLVGLWLGLCFELVFRGCIFTARFLRGTWTHTTV